MKTDSFPLVSLYNSQPSSRLPSHLHGDVQTLLPLGKGATMHHGLVGEQPQRKTYFGGYVSSKEHDPRRGGPSLKEDCVPNTGIMSQSFLMRIPQPCRTFQSLQSPMSRAALRCPKGRQSFSILLREEAKTREGRGGLGSLQGSPPPCSLAFLGLGVLHWCVSNQSNASQICFLPSGFPVSQTRKGEKTPSKLFLVQRKTRDTNRKPIYFKN